MSDFTNVENTMPDAPAGEVKLACGKRTFLPDVKTMPIDGDYLHAMHGYGHVLAVTRGYETVGWIPADEVGYVDAKEFLAKHGAWKHWGSR